MPLLDCNNERATYAFLDKLFNEFGVLVETLINQGMEFHKKFQELCESSFINHCIISRNHPKVDGLIERMV